MSLYDYEIGRALATLDHPFNALIFAAIRQADTANMAKIAMAWPEIAAEAQARYDAPGALLPGDTAREALAGEDFRAVPGADAAAWAALITPEDQP